MTPDAPQEQKRRNDPDASKEHFVETFKSLITLSVEGFRYLALINGGALVALLAYLGNVTKNGVALPDLRCALFFFLFGLVGCGVALFFAYCTQLRLFQELSGQIPKDSQHPKMLSRSMWAYASSLGMFFIAAVLTVIAFSSADRKDTPLVPPCASPSALAPCASCMSGVPVLPAPCMSSICCDPLGMELLAQPK